MISTIGELCDAALSYLLMVNVGNKYKRYMPTGSLDTGTCLKQWTYKLRVPAENGYVDTEASIGVHTSESIPESYLNKVTDSKITDDWNKYKKMYIYSKINQDTYISTSSMFYFIYLFRYFIDKHFKMFTDIYGKSFVWLYNTANDVTYSPTNLSLKENETTVSSIEKYVDILIDEVASRETIQTLQASTSFNSCSSSSSSSSCSSSSSSSSCSSSSSSSSSSLFIAYFNLG